VVSEDKNGDAQDHEPAKDIECHDHASTVFEDYCRHQYSDASRYWEGDLEFDLVRSEQHESGKQTLIVAEVKWRSISAAERQEAKKRLEEAFQRSALRNRYPDVTFKVLDASVLKAMRREPLVRQVIAKSAPTRSSR